jgi:hypothetical protein
MPAPQPGSQPSASQPVGYASPANCGGVSPCSGPVLNYPNNPVQGYVTVYLVYWGPLWSQGFANSSQTITASQDVINGLNGSNFQQVLSQYYSSSAVIDPQGVTLGGTWIDPLPPTVINPQNVLNEANRAQSQNAGWQSDPTHTQYLIFPQPGAVYSQTNACGWHTYGMSNNVGQANTTYVASAIYWQPDVGNCVANGPSGNVWNAETFVLSHEYAETVSDPFLNAWVTSGGQEVGDLCIGYAGSYAVGGQWVTSLWSNQAVNGSMGCTTFINRTFSFSYMDNTALAGQTLANGHGYGVTLHVRNTGNMPWQVGAWNHSVVHLGTWNPQDRCSAFNDGTWMGCTRIPIAANQGRGGSFPILPNDVAEFDWNFNPHAGVATGSYTETFNLVADGITWMACAGGCLNWGLSVGRFDDCYVSQTDPSGLLTPGDTYSASVSFRNCGTAEWWPYSLPILGTSHPHDRASAFVDTSWPSSVRPEYVTSYTPPNGTFTFTYNLHVPCKQTAGTYHEYFGMLASGTTWMTDYNYQVTLNVGSVADVLKCPIL